MAEAILAFGVAANVIQFVDFSSKILSEDYRLHNSEENASRKNQELEGIAVDLQKLANELQGTSNKESQSRTLHRMMSTFKSSLSNVGAFVSNYSALERL